MILLQTMERARSQETGIFKKKPADLIQIFKVCLLNTYMVEKIFTCVSEVVFEVNVIRHFCLHM